MNFAIASRGNETAIGREPNSEHAAPQFSVIAFGPFRLMGRTKHLERPAILRIPPDEFSVLAAGSKKTAVRPPMNGANGVLLFGQAQQNPA